MPRLPVPVRTGYNRGGDFHAIPFAEALRYRGNAIAQVAAAATAVIFFAFSVLTLRRRL